MTLTAVPGIRVGHAQVPGGGSGCTVVLGPFHGAVEVRGLASGTRELETLSPYHLVSQVDGVLLTGGSAFGLAAADGVMAWLSERGRGFDAGVARVPLVPAAVIFDLAPGVARPGSAEGRNACQNASDAPVPEGRVGAGTGATVGKAMGAVHGSPGGLGSASRRWRHHSVGALAVVNAFGEVVSGEGSVLGGSEGGRGPGASLDAFLGGSGAEGPAYDLGTAKGLGAGDQGGSEELPGGSRPTSPGENTTLVVVGIDLLFGFMDLGRLARMACGAFPRAIAPVHTPYDGDVLFALGTGGPGTALPPEDLLRLGVAARQVTEDAIRRAVAVGKPESTRRSGAGR